MAYASYNGTTSVVSEVPQAVTILTGAANGTLVRSLEISNPTESSGVVTVKRVDASDNEYGVFSLRVGISDYLIMWENCQVFVPYGHELVIEGDIDGIEAVANCWEIPSA